MTHAEHLRKDAKTVSEALKAEIRRVQKQKAKSRKPA